MRVEIDIGESRVAADGQRKTLRWGQPEVGFVEPVGDEGFEMPPAADALYAFLPGERRMPGEDLETVKPAVLDDEEPSRVAEAIAAANQARRMFSDWVIHHRPPWRLAGVGSGASKEAWSGAAAEGNGQHPKVVVESQREVSAAGIAEPEMFAPAQLLPVALERDARVGWKSFGKKQLAFAQGTEWNCACGVGAFMQHRLGPIFSSVELRPERFQ